MPTAALTQPPPPPSPRPLAPWQCALYALAFTALAVLLRKILDPLMGDTLPLVTLFGAIALAEWVGGYTCALLVIVLGYIACAYLFMVPRGTLGLSQVVNQVGLAAYLFTCGMIILFGEGMRWAERRARAAERVAHARSEALRVTLTSIGDAVITTDTAGAITFLNPVAERLTGWTLDAAVGEPLARIFRIVNEHTRAAVDNPVAKVIEHGEAFGLANHTVLIRRDGSECPIEDSAAPIRDADGAIVGVVMVFHDVTERRASQNAVTESETRFRRSVTQSPIPMILHWEDGAIVEMSEGWTRFSGYSLADMPTIEDWTRLAYGERHEKVKKVIERLFALDATEHTGEYQIRAKDGSLRIWDFYTTPIGASGPAQQRMLLSTAVDITERKHVESVLQETDQRKDEFLATLAHELRNPLAPLRTGLELLKLAPGQTRVDELRAMLQRQVDQLVRLVDDLLDISRISFDKIELRKEFGDLRSAVKTALEATRPMLEDKGIALEVDLPAEPLQLRADSARIAQVLVNLLSNAAKFTARGGRVQLSVARVDSEALITVRDNGVGIAREDLKRLFRMFSQVHSLEGEPQKGLGIGLALAKRLTELHGGCIEAHSDGISHGSTFIVRLPIVVPTGTAAVSPALVPDGHAAKLKILIVDDNEDAAASLAELLRLHGHSTRVVHDGFGAIQAAESYLPQVVLLDLGLPRMSGYEVAQHLRNQPWGADLLLVAVTGWGLQTHRQQSQEAGFDHHLIKPVDWAALEKLLAQCGNQSAAQHDPGAPNRTRPPAASLG